MFAQSTVADRQVVISAWQGRAVVGRYVGGGSFTRLEPARNWRGLEEDARKALHGQGNLQQEGQFPCPITLAARAVWPVQRLAQAEQPAGRPAYRLAFGAGRRVPPTKAPDGEAKVVSLSAWRTPAAGW